MEEDQQYLLTVAKGIVNHPDDVKVERRVDEKGVLLTLHVNPADMGYVVGRRGKTAEALRTLLRIVGAKHNARVSIQIHDPNHQGDRSDRMPMGDVDTSAVENLNI
ncbi:MAG TPA: RNA-binding protein [Candidatus Magasanikbacteria bacterium]|nr:RNA-binding protein [Candidatus Magasanikbacteria bacterium]